MRPLGFSLDDKQLKRAGLDYHEYASVAVHDSWTALIKAMSGRRMFAFATSGERLFTDVRYARDDVLVFGREADGLPSPILEQFPPEMRLRLPMRPGNRSLNLSNAVAVAVFEAWPHRLPGCCGLNCFRSGFAKEAGCFFGRRGVDVELRPPF